MCGDPSGGVVCVVARNSEGGTVRFLVVCDHLWEGEVFKERGGHWGDD